VRVKKRFVRREFASVAWLSGLTMPLLLQIAQAAETDVPTGEVVVSGIRKSVSQSVGDKHDLDVVADVIAAEDVGKFPDKNVAEALQRVTGVQITRDANEGKFVSVRGLPSEFNYVTLNGQAATSASDNQTVQGADRNFDFSLLTPEFVSFLEVYKSARADLEEGALSATINLRTVRPFDFEGRRIVFSGQAQEYGIKHKAGPDIAGLYSDVWSDGHMGLTLGVAWNRRFFQGSATDTSQFDLKSLGTTGALMLDNDSISSTDQLRDTRSYYAAWQWRPIDSLVTSVISMYARFAGDRLSRSFALRPVYSFDPATFDYEVDSSGVVTRAVGSDIYIGASNFRQWDDGTLSNHMLQLEWLPGAWTVRNVLAFSRSTTHSQELGFEMARAGFLGLGTAVSGGYEIVPGRPIASFVMSPGFDPGDPSAYRNGYIGGNVLDRMDRLWSEQLDITFKGDMTAVESVKFGLRVVNRRRDNGAFFLEDDTQRGADLSRFANGSPLRGLPIALPDFDSQRYLDAQFGGSYENWANASTTQLRINEGNQYGITEETRAAYLMVNLRFFAGLPVRGNLGARVVRTRQAITDSAVDFNAIQFDPGPLLPAGSVSVPAAAVERFDRRYTDVLPSLNLTLDLSQDLLLRFGVAKVMSRPTIESLVPRYTVKLNPNLVSGGNPDLDPFRAVQYDLSLEWYFRAGSLLSVALYDKQIDSFIQQSAESLDIQGRSFTRLLPVNGSGGYVRGAEFQFTQVFDFLPSVWSGLGLQANLTYARGQVDADPLNDIPAHDFAGLSRYTYNVVAFYEKYGFGLRFAYNSRDAYLSDPNIRGQDTSAAYGEHFATLDVQAGYDLSSHLNVYLEGNNLLRKDSISSLRTLRGEGGSYPLSWAKGDRRLALGLRVEF